MGSWTVPASAISNTSVTPNSGSGMSATFSAVFTDPTGAGDLATATVLIAANAGVAGRGITWSRSLNAFQVANSTLCSLDATARATDSGNTVTLTLPVTFKAAFN